MNCRNSYQRHCSYSLMPGDRSQACSLVHTKGPCQDGAAKNVWCETGDHVVWFHERQGPTQCALSKLELAVGRCRKRNGEGAMHIV